MISTFGMPIISTHLAIIKTLKRYFPAVKLFKPGADKTIEEKPVYFSSVRPLDFFLDPNKSPDKSKLPSINVGMARMIPSSGAYIDNDSYEVMPEAGASEFGLIQAASEYMDLQFVLHFNSDNTALIHYFMSRSVPVFRREFFELAVEDIITGQRNCYEIDVTKWPDGSGNTPNIHGLFEARLEFIVRGVEFPVEDLTKVPVITEVLIPTHKIGQIVTANVVGGEVIITIGDENG